MLSKPGEARSNSTPGSYRSNRKAIAVETPDDIVRRLQRVPSNKACADCSSKMTQCVNLTHGTFVCMVCSGVHREFNHKIKGIGHSSFTTDEASMLNHPSMGNEAVNSRYLARYDADDTAHTSSPPSFHRGGGGGGSSYNGGMSMRMPTDNLNLQHLRSWIQSKYMDRHWIEGGVEATPASSAASAKTKSGVVTSGGSGRRKIMPQQRAPRASQPTATMAVIPTATAPAPSPPPPIHDPFSSMPISSSVHRDDDDGSWDAFDAIGPASAVEFPVPSSAPEAFQADFGHFDGQQQQTQQQRVTDPYTNLRADFGHFAVQQQQQQQTQQQQVADPNANLQADFAHFDVQQQQQQHVTDPNTNLMAGNNNDRASVFDAFDGLSLEPTITTDAIASVALTNDDVGTGGTAAATLLGAAPAAPYEGGHHVPNSIVHAAGDSKNGNNDHAMMMLRETTLMLQMLNYQQLVQVRQLISSMVSSSSSSSSLPGNHHNATAAAGTSFESTMNAGLDRQQQINMAFGELVPMQSLLPATSGPQFSMHQHHTPSGPPSTLAAPTQYSSSEQHFSNGMSQQAHAAGPMRSTHLSHDATLLVSPSPPPPIAALASPAVPLVEKEGNPFDF